MKLKNALIGIGIGISATLLVREALKDHPLTSADLLCNMKEYFKNVKGKVSGSWISTIKEDFFHEGEAQVVFRGGITFEDGDTLKRFECLINPYSGDIIKASKI